MVDCCDTERFILEILVQSRPAPWDKSSPCMPIRMSRIEARWRLQKIQFKMKMSTTDEIVSYIIIILLLLLHYTVEYHSAVQTLIFIMINFEFSTLLVISWWPYWQWIESICIHWYWCLIHFWYFTGLWEGRGSIRESCWTKQHFFLL